MDLHNILNDFLTSTSLVAMSVAAAVDILAGTYEALAAHTFSFQLFPKWLESKVLKGILPVLAMYAASIGLASPFKESLAGAAALGAAAFIAGQTASIFKHFQVAPPEDEPIDEEPVPEVAKG